VSSLPESADRFDRSIERAAGAASSAAEGRSGTYAQILRSSIIIGGSSAANVLVSIARTKAMAVMLGPAGFGLMGAFTTIVDLARSVAQLGISNSGVRQIAQSAGSADGRRIALTVFVLRRTAVVLGILGALLLAAFSKQVAVITFGNETHADAVTLLALAVFLRLVADGQGALLQGLRRIGDMARISVISALVGTVLSVAVVYALRENGIALSLVVMAAASTLASWWFSRSVEVERATFTASAISDETKALLRLGLAFMASALLTMGAAYLVRIVLIHHEGLVAAGLFQAAWTIGGLYITFVLQAMGADFYPRLVAAASNDAECNRLVNEQAQVSLLIASVGVLATLTLAPWAIAILYRGDFVGATDVLRWICLGMALRVLTWPLGYVLIAKGKQALFVGADLAWTVVNVGLTWLCVKHFGLTGAGIAFFASYVFHLMVVYPMCRRLSGFRWSTTNVRISLAFAGSIAVVHCGFYWLSAPAATAVGLIALGLTTGAAIYVLRSLVSADQLPKKLAWLAQRKRESA
jgi:enterobacterial common antigen flippase